MTEQKTKNLAQRLLAVMQESTEIGKDLTVSTGRGSYAAVSHDAVMRMVVPLMVKNGVIMPSSVISEKYTEERYTNDYGKEAIRGMTELRTETTFINVDDPEDKLSVRGYGQAIDNQDKGAGKAYSYSVKYALLKTLGLVTGEDSDTDGEPRKPQKVTPVKETPLKTNPVEPEGESKVTPEEIDDTLEKGQEDAFKTSTTPLDVFMDLMNTNKTPEALKGFWTKAENVKFRAGLTEEDAAKVMARKDKLKGEFAKKDKEAKK